STSPRVFSHRCCSYRNITPPSLAPPPFLHVDAQDHRRRLGFWLLSQVEPSEIFLKSISNEVTNIEVIYPSSLNAQLVRRRLRHIAMRGTIIHQKYLYATVSLIPFSSALMVLPLPNIAFFWVSFRAYSHWRAFQWLTIIRYHYVRGVEELLVLSPGMGQVLELMKYSYNQVKQWKPKDWARPVARISGDGSADLIDQFDSVTILKIYSRRCIKRDGSKNLKNIRY
ncbi:hypothetical protein S245_012786, partial [Arachis hypogaea]